LKVLRHYADFLGLPGDRYLLVLVEHWPTGSLSAPVVTVHTAPPVLHDDTGLVPQIQQIQPRVEQAPARTAASRLVDVRGLPLASSLGHTASTTSNDDSQTTAQVPRIDRTGPLHAHRSHVQRAVVAVRRCGRARRLGKLGAGHG
jgi:hypothetical protein